MTRTKKTVRKGFDYRNCDDFTAYLNHMARQGWHFREWRAGLVFEQGEPENAVYSVEIFTKADESDIRPLPETKEFAEYCEAAGWQFVDAWRKFVVFKRIREDAAPILTDEERFDNIVKAEKPSVWYPLIHTLVWCLMKLSEFSYLFPQRIFSQYSLILSTVWVVLFLICLLRAVHFLLWKRQCRLRMDRGLSLFFGKSQADKWYGHLYSLVIALCALSMFLIGQRPFGLVLLAMILAMTLLSFIIARLRPDSATAGVIEILGSSAILLGVFLAALYVDQADKDKHQVILEPPLTFASMGIEMEEPEIHYSRESESFFGIHEYANLDYGVDYLFYDIYTTEYDWVLDKLWEEETDGKASETWEDCTDAWGAVEAFRNGAGDYLIRYEDAIWVICPSLDEPLISEQITLAIAAIRGE